mgnify:CR=1 FL=1
MLSRATVHSSCCTTALTRDVGGGEGAERWAARWVGLRAPLGTARRGSSVALAAKPGEGARAAVVPFAGHHGGGPSLRSRMRFWEVVKTKAHVNPDDLEFGSEELKIN